MICSATTVPSNPGKRNVSDRQLIIALLFICHKVSVLIFAEAHLHCGIIYKKNNWSSGVPPFLHKWNLILKVKFQKISNIINSLGVIGEVLK